MHSPPFHLLVWLAVTAIAQRGPGEICAPYPGAFCEEGLSCVSCRPNVPGVPGGD
ncbi:hypothetical protein BO86DRAFT_392322, partial [Aspergillus japonicus CBS 114.51]